MVNRKGRIATIIPARNEEKFIGKTLTALLN
jgi:glycosyltransferase involved in cell wall biosynthesis